jgi:hypothetical protein
LASLRLFARQGEPYETGSKVDSARHSSFRRRGRSAEAHVVIEVANHGKGLGAVGRLLGTIQFFSDLLGGPTIPNLSTLVGKPIGQALKPLDAVVITLKMVHDLIPVP